MEKGAPLDQKRKEKMMEECKTCELAIYCYSECTTWIFRTKQEMDDKQEAMERCPHYEKVQKSRAPDSQQCASG